MTGGHWYPLYEKLCELDVPAMIHVSSSYNPNFHHTGAHYLNVDTAAFMQLLGDLAIRSVANQGVAGVIHASLMPWM